MLVEMEFIPNRLKLPNDKSKWRMHPARGNTNEATW